MGKRVVIALGGNALQQRGQKGSYEEMMDNVRKTARQIAEIIARGYEVVITHGNGPQVGSLLLHMDAGQATYGIPAQPMDVAGAMSQGWIGYMIQQALKNELRKRGMEKKVVTIITQTIVDKNDPAFQNPTKPVGPFYDEETAKRLAREKGWIVKEDSGRGWRRVVPSPDPKGHVEAETIKKLVERGVIVIASGGGGVPVILEDGEIKGVEAVIDKDLAGEKLAEEVNADIFMILTDVNGAALYYGTEKEQWLREVKVEELRKYYEEGHFKAGSMGPKVLAAIRFIEWGGERAIIAHLEKAVEALEGKTGTQVLP
ncbi:carbamate kinase [Pyrococcus furiosus DSM 3638]|uniref:Carbamate kinase n=3 Tax=Pyrococcus furiosus TaxID=2261 RepID=CPKA_PYRFU|nr:MULTISPECIES: carbamate kinase [Pyrococcus]P95474.1 RecName: Full=Carbamate kinase; AltName: Full=Carbamate kinase-like carbamoylphosphate synthase [Pyrococcus furiosus DSM 3638]1E19_A Chain A, CARBAMATE KINASE [Pyrococcus furiosus]1E19_B Chain B, CARBAMATE KINASE [Pyrococcus furiosus]AAL80800.1 carbamate kinase-like carbamoylphosphate synthetase [Pyrococcus furiosus DSM 3638]AFN03470.1 carbamate kinase-like carbamoyl phosphate synthetase [Pyrococcus furiosus COM1]MDK2869911.1 carbamate ki